MASGQEPRDSGGSGAGDKPERYFTVLEVQVDGDEAVGGCLERPAPSLLVSRLRPWRAARILGVVSGGAFDQRERVAVGVEQGARWELCCWPGADGALDYAVMAVDTGMSFSPQTITPGAVEPTVAFFELKPTFDAAMIAGTVPQGVQDAVLHDSEGGSQRLTLIPCSFTTFYVAPAARDVEWVRVVAHDSSGRVTEATQRSVRLRMRAERPFDPPRDDELEKLASGEVAGVGWRLLVAHEGKRLRVRVRTTANGHPSGEGRTDDRLRPGELLRICLQLRTAELQVVTAKVDRQVAAVVGITERGERVAATLAPWQELAYDFSVVATTERVAGVIAYNQSGDEMARVAGRRPGGA